MRQLLGRVVAPLRGRRVRVRLMIEPPKPVGDTWLLRLRCQNPGKPDAFDAAIVAVENESDSAFTTPWPLAWRGHPGAREVRLATRGGELLRLALFHSDPPATFVLLGAAPEGEPERRHALTDATVVVRVQIRRNGRIDADAEIRLSSRPGRGGALVPIVTIVS
jgi:hypothetical protein